MENMKEEFGGVEDSESPIYVCHKFGKKKIVNREKVICLFLRMKRKTYLVSPSKEEQRETSKVGFSLFI